MPGSTEYSMAPAGLSGVSKTVATTPTLVSNPVTTAKLGDAYTNLPEVYKTQDFNEQNYRDQLLATKYGTEASRRDKRKFNRYMKSEEGLAEMDKAKQAHTQAENQKWSQSLKARSQAMDQESTRRLEAMKAEWDNAVAQYDTRSAELEAQDLTARIAGQARFGDAFRLARQSGLETFTWRGKSYGTKYATEVGTSGKSTRSTTPAPAPVPAPAPKAEAKPVTANPVIPETPVSTSSSAQTPAATSAATPAPAPSSSKFNLEAWAKEGGWPISTIKGKSYARYDRQGLGDFWVGEDGSVYYAGAFGNLGSDASKYKPEPGSQEARYYNDLTQSITNYTPKAQTLAVINDGAAKAQAYAKWQADYLAQNPQPARSGSMAYATDLSNWNNKFNAAKKAAGFKQGGTMNRIKYFQQGGAAPQQDIEAQVTALVQAAMQGDQQATQQVNQILEAAKAGDQQAMQIAQMIQQIVEQMQGQATAAKWGAKLGYIKSLKYAKGGKTCPACEKQVEMKACGGKKAKKRYFGGLI